MENLIRIEICYSLQDILVSLNFLIVKIFMIPSRGFNGLSSQQSRQSKINSVGERFPINRSLMEVIKGLEGASTEMVERSKTIFFPRPVERVYLLEGDSNIIKSWWVAKR